MNPIQYFKKFNSEAKKNAVTGNIISFVKFLRYRIYYKIGIKDYFENELYDNTKNHDVYFSTLHTAIHKWNYVKPRFIQNKSLLKAFLLRIDYFFAKILYPGLDAMDYFRYEFYNFRHPKRKSFITEGYLVKMDNVFNGGESRRNNVQLLQNKDRFNTLFEDFISRKWILTREVGEEEFLNFCEGLTKVIIKPIDGGAGHGIFIRELKSPDDVHLLYLDVYCKNFIAEEVIEQHEAINKLNPSSVNTIRVYSICKDNEVYITGGTLRIGCGNKPIDNYSAGGLAAEIDVDTGLVISPAVTQNGEKYYRHPFTNVPIIGVEIPLWYDIKETVKRAHLRISNLGYVGWDVVVCKDGSITFLEANTCSGVELQQHPGLNGKRHVYDSFL